MCAGKNLRMTQKKASPADLIKKSDVLETDACAAAKHKIILLQPQASILHGLQFEKKYVMNTLREKEMRFLSKACLVLMLTINNQNMTTKLLGNNTEYES